jgi:hypothetical protein
MESASCLLGISLFFISTCYCTTVVHEDCNLQLSLQQGWHPIAGQSCVDGDAHLFQKSLLQRAVARKKHGLSHQSNSRKYLFIFSTGRAGSTSLMKMVNAIPGYYLAGENGGVMNLFVKMNITRMDFGDSIIEEHGVHNVTARGGEAWNHKPISQRRVRNAVRDYITAIIGETDEKQVHTIGFKEIRHWNRSELDEFVNVFPEARFIVNTRADVKAQAASQLQYFLPGTSPGKAVHVSKLQKATVVLEQWAADHPSNSFLMRLEEFNLNKYNEMLRWLGEDHCHFSDIATENTVDGYYSGHHNELIRCAE